MTQKKMKYVGHVPSCKDCSQGAEADSWKSRIGKTCYLLDDTPSKEGTVFVRFEDEAYPAMAYLRHLEPLE